MERFRFLTLLLLVFSWDSALSESFPEVKSPEVKIINVGYVTSIEGRELIPGVDEENGGRLVASTIAVVKGKDAMVVVDPGFVPYRRSLLRALRRNGVQPWRVTHVFTSHHHPDHTRNVALFPNAKWVDFWAIYKGDLWEDHGDNYEIGEGIVVKRTPGHTDEDASLLVRTAQGTVVFTHLWWNKAFFPAGADPLAEEVPDEPGEPLGTSRDYVLDKSNIPDLFCIVPGHGEPFRPENSEDDCGLMADGNRRWGIR